MVVSSCAVKRKPFLGIVTMVSFSSLSSSCPYAPVMTARARTVVQNLGRVIDPPMERIFGFRAIRVKCTDLSREKESIVKLATNLLAALTLSLASAVSWAQEKVVYHFDGGLEQATKGLRNISNHLEVDPQGENHRRDSCRRSGFSDGRGEGPPRSVRRKSPGADVARREIPGVRDHDAHPQAE